MYTFVQTKQCVGRATSYTNGVSLIETSEERTDLVDNTTLIGAATKTQM